MVTSCVRIVMDEELVVPLPTEEPDLQDGEFPDYQPEHAEEVPVVDAEPVPVGWYTPQVRDAIYGVLIAVGALLFAFNLVTQEQIDAWMKFVQAGLGLFMIYGFVMAKRNVGKF